MKEFMKRHYPKAKYIVMKGWAEDEIVKHLKQTSEHALVVMGAYRREPVKQVVSGKHGRFIDERSETAVVYRT